MSCVRGADWTYLTETVCTQSSWGSVETSLSVTPARPRARLVQINLLGNAYNFRTPWLITAKPATTFELKQIA